MNFLLRQYQTHRSQHNTAPATPCGRREVSRHSSASLIGHVPVKGRERGKRGIGKEGERGKLKRKGKGRMRGRMGGRVKKSKVPYIPRFYTE